MSRIEASTNNPNNKEYRRGKDAFKNAEELIDIIRDHRSVRIMINTIIKISLYGGLLITPEGRRMLKNAEARRTLYDREARVGLLEDSIISDELYIPNKERISLEKKTTVAGRFVGYDFHRPEEFKSAAKNRELQNQNGRLIIFTLDEIKNNNEDKYTPTDLLNLLDIAHFLSFDTFSLEEAIKQGYLKETTYKESYEKVGLYSKYKMYLELQQLNDKPIYAVTPKGNSVVCLIKDGGKKQEHPKKVGAFNRNFLPIPI